MELVLMAALLALLAYVIWMGVQDTRFHNAEPARLQVNIPGTKSAYPVTAPPRPPLGLIVDGFTVVPSAY